MNLDEVYVPTCADCKHACYYPAYWWFPWFDPKCEITKIRVQHDDIACDDFELMGRHGR